MGGGGADGEGVSNVETSSNLRCNQMEDRRAAEASQLPVPSAVFPSFVAGKDAKATAFEPHLAGGDNSLEQEAMQIAVDVVVVEPQGGAAHSVSLPASPSSSAEQSKKSPVLELDVAAAATSEDAEDDDVMEEEATWMAVDMVQPQVEPPCPSSPVESPSLSVGEDKKGHHAFGSHAAATTSGFVGGDDILLEEEAAQIAVDGPGFPADVSLDAMEEEDDEQIAVEAADFQVVRARKGGGRRKRGRQPKAQVVRAPPTWKKEEEEEEEEEEVCFICFDGSDLVVC